MLTPVCWVSPGLFVFLPFFSSLSEKLAHSLCVFVAFGVALVSVSAVASVVWVVLMVLVVLVVLMVLF